MVRHTLGEVDHLLIADNLSTDGTREILAKLVDEGLPITLTDDPEDRTIKKGILPLQGS